MKNEEKLYLPVLHSFENDNVYTGSLGLLRFRIVPSVTMKNSKEVDNDASSINAEYWHGEYCYEKSTVEGKQTFPMSEQGREAMREWLLEKA